MNNFVHNIFGVIISFTCFSCSALKATEDPTPTIDFSKIEIGSVAPNLQAMTLSSFKKVDMLTDADKYTAYMQKATDDEITAERYLIVDSKTSIVVEKSYWPSGKSPDLLVADFLKIHLPQLKMLRIEAPVCTDNVGSDAYLVNEGAHLIIHFYTRRNEIDSVLWLNPELYKETLALVKKCRKIMTKTNPSK